MGSSRPPCLLTYEEGFFRLPRELRDQVYLEILRPDQIDFYGTDDTPLGCSKIFVLNRQIHAEAKLLIENHEHEIHINGCGQRIMRNMFEFGIPSHFRSSVSFWSCPQPPKYCELQILRFRKLCLSIDCSWLRWNHDWEWHDCHESAGRWSTLMQVDEITQVLEKSPALKCLRLKLFKYGYIETTTLTNPQPPLGWDELSRALSKNSDDGLERSVTLSALRRLVRIAQKKQANLIIESDVQFLVGQALCYSLSTFDDLTIDGYLVESQPCFEKLMVQPIDHSGEALNDSPDYQLIPECRTCYALFASRSDLMKHCCEEGHWKKFEIKQYNLLFSRYPQRTIPRHVCFTCAKGFETTTAKGDHEKRVGHRRESMIPRWVEVGQNDQTSNDFAKTTHSRGQQNNRRGRRRGFVATRSRWLNNSAADNKCITVYYNHDRPKCNGKCESDQVDPNNKGDPQYAIRWGYPRDMGSARCMGKQPKRGNFRS